MVKKLHSNGMNNSGNQIIFGSFELVLLPDLSSDTFIAKVDTGAYSGAIHCSLLREVIRDGQKTLRFRPLTAKKTLKTSNYTRRFVRSSTGHRTSRYLIDTQIVIGGVTYSTRIGLSNRTDLQYEILIGRRFLRDNGVIVDVRLNKELDIEEQTIA